MANNFKSLQQPFTTANQTIDLLTCSVTAIIVSKVQINILPSGTGKFHLLLTKSGQGSVKLATKKWATSNDDEVFDLIDKSFVLEDGDVITGQTENSGTTVQVTVHYMERTADVATSALGDLSNVSGTTATDGQFLVYDNATGTWGPQTLSGANLGTASDTGDLPEDTVGAEPRNRYMKGLNGLDDLTDNSSNLPAHVLYSDPANVHFVVENNSLSTPVVQKVTWDQLIKSIIEVGVNDLVAAGYGSTATYTSSGGILGDLNGDGAVGSGDLLEFLVLFGQSWADNAGAFWQPTTATVANANNTIISSSVTTLSFDSPDVTVTQGTQAVTVSGAANTITIESGSGNTPMSALSTKKLRVTSESGVDAFTVITYQADEIVQYWVVVRCYDSSGVQVGSTVQYQMAQGNFGEAGTYSTGTAQANTFGDIPASEFTGNITDGLANTDIEKIVVNFGASNSSGDDTIVIINNLQIALVNG
jgi:hypothetical protein